MSYNLTTFPERIYVTDCDQIDSGFNVRVSRYAADRYTDAVKNTEYIRADMVDKLVESAFKLGQYSHMDTKMNDYIKRLIKVSAGLEEME